MCTIPSISSAFLTLGMASYRRSNSARLSRSPVFEWRDFLVADLRHGSIRRRSHCRNRLSVLGRVMISEVAAIGNQRRPGLSRLSSLNFTPVFPRRSRISGSPHSGQIASKEDLLARKAPLPLELRS